MSEHDEQQEQHKGSGEPVIPDEFDEVTDSMPEPTAGVADREEAKVDEQEEKEKEWRDNLRDSDGYPFDPNMHATDENGEPKLTTRGKLRKRPGRKTGGGAKRQSSLGSKKTQQAEIDAKKKAEARAAGSLCGNLFINTCVTVGGSDFKPRDENDAGYDEREMMQTAFADYFEAKGWTDFPPGIALAFVTSAYIMPRFNMPQTKGRINKAVDMFKRWREKRNKQKAKEDKKEKRGGWGSRKSE